ncbi:7TM GPCR protein [Aphelenchoides avenae]|nr:7TM GPCR protein [Aphelenchus avenae]
MKPHCLPDWYGRIELSSATISICANTLLIFLILFKTPHDLKVYSRVLLCNCVVDIFYTVSAYMIELHMYFRNGIVIYTVKDAFGSSLHGRFLQTSLFWFATYLTIFIISVPFVYRYCAVCHKCIMSNTAFGALVLFEVLVACFAAMTLYVLWWPNVVATTERLLENPDLINFSDRGRVPHYTVEEATSPRIASVLVMYITLVALHYAVIIFCSYKICKKLRSTTGMNRRTSALNSQLNNVLFLQALTPFFVAVIPICGCIIMLLFSLEWLGRLLELTTSVLSWMPIMNPVFTVIFVKAYRYAITGGAKRRVQQAVTMITDGTLAVPTTLAAGTTTSGTPANDAGYEYDERQ